MKTRYIRMKRLIPLLGIMLVAAGVVWVATYLDIERKIHADEALTAKLTRLYYDQTVSAMLKRIQEGDVTGAVHRLDQMLCDDILELNSQMASVDNRQRSYTQNAFVRIAHTRPRNAVITAGTSLELYPDQIEAEKILVLADAGNTPVNQTVAASR